MQTEIFIPISFTNRIIFSYKMMSRRPVSPIRRVSTDITGPAYDERDFIIKKLK